MVFLHFSLQPFLYTPFSAAEEKEDKEKGKCDSNAKLDQLRRRRDAKKNKKEGKNVKNTFQVAPGKKQEEEEEEYDIEKVLRELNVNDADDKKKKDDAKTSKPRKGKGKK